MTEKGLCPKTGRVCFYTEWHQAAQDGKGSFDPEQVDSLLERSLEEPNVAEFLVCDQDLAAEGDPESLSCAAYALLVSMAIVSVTYDRPDGKFNEQEVVNAVRVMSGVADN